MLSSMLSMRPQRGQSQQDEAGLDLPTMLRQRGPQAARSDHQGKAFLEGLELGGR